MAVPAETTRSRRHLQEILNEKAIEYTQRQIGGLFRTVERSFMPPDTSAEAAGRAEALNEGARLAVYGCLTYLRMREPQTYQAIVRAGLRYAEDRIADGRATWSVRREKKPPMWWFAFPFLLSAHEECVRRLKANWSQVPRPEQIEKSYGYMDAPQRKGLARRRSAITGRIAIVKQLVGELIDKGMNHVGVPDDSKVQRWVRLHTSPAALSKRILGYVLNRTPRQIEALLNDARKKNAANLAMKRAFDAWEKLDR